MYLYNAFNMREHEASIQPDRWQSKHSTRQIADYAVLSLEIKKEAFNKTDYKASIKQDRSRTMQCYRERSRIKHAIREIMDHAVLLRETITKSCAAYHHYGTPRKCATQLDFVQNLCSLKWIDECIQREVVPE